MKKILLIFSAALVMMLGSCERTPDVLPQDEDQLLIKISEGDIVPGQYVVLLKDGVTTLKSSKLSYPDARSLMRSEMQKVLRASEIPEKEPLQIYTEAVEGFAVRLSGEEAEALERNPGVQGVWPDKVIVLAKPVRPPAGPAPQTTPPGITRVGGGATYTGTKKAWIIDTGIDLTHPDLNVDKENGKTFVPRTTTPNDDNGHGTHCAGIIAAIDNTIGVVGVAAGAKVVPVKVLDKRGSGYMSTIIAGVDYVAASGTSGDAVNMSLGGGAYEPLDAAVIAMGEKGLLVALAAGNSSADAGNYSPARANGTNIYTVSACDSKDVWAYFSNYRNPPVDFCAPGVSIYSTYKGGAYATMSGTSMAAPHVCGVLLALGKGPNTKGYVINDPDGNPDPIAYK